MVAVTMNCNGRKVVEITKKVAQTNGALFLKQAGTSLAAFPFRRCWHFRKCKSADEASSVLSFSNLSHHNVIASALSSSPLSTDPPTRSALRPLGPQSAPLPTIFFLLFA
jgi:hypothetical protein